MGVGASAAITRKDRRALPRSPSLVPVRSERPTALDADALLYGTARATARGISELPGLAAHRVGAADDGQLGRPDRFAACRADGPWPERWFREHYAHVFSLSPDEARHEMMRFFADPDQFEQIGLIPLGYNRAILLMAQAFHGTGETFGDSPETGRLSPHFEFYAA